jgi:hypothetical protein
VLKRDKGKKPGVEAGTNLTSDVGTEIKTPNSCMTEGKKERKRKKEIKKRTRRRK